MFVALLANNPTFAHVPKLVRPGGHDLVAFAHTANNLDPLERRRSDGDSSAFVTIAMFQINDLDALFLDYGGR
jgi:hypothetical protein